MEEKLLRGNELMEEAMQQEKKLLKTKAEVEERRREQLRIEQEAKKLQHQKLSLQKNFNS